MGQCQRWELHCSVYYSKGAHEYPVLDRRPGSNDLELDFRWFAQSHVRELPLLARLNSSADDFCYCLRHGLHIRENLRFLNTGMEFSKNLYASVLKAPSRN